MKENVLNWDVDLALYVRQHTDEVLTFFQCINLKEISKHNNSLIGFALDNLGLKICNRKMSPFNLAVDVYKYSCTPRQGQNTDE
jgi:hypothetical protein